ncbi:MAG: hypothetical protein KatS3mg110_1072 [Pirellulaceae bacterium]|nr:MAG: hypothetical protein KatS3mg110_1072 [Pirellulaceae bacterium]
MAAAETVAKRRSKLNDKGSLAIVHRGGTHKEQQMAAQRPSGQGTGAIRAWRVGWVLLALCWAWLAGGLPSSWALQETHDGQSSTNAQATEPDAPPVTASLSALPPQLVEVYGNRRPPEPADLPLMDAHQRELVERLRPCVVALQIGDAQGSGVVVSPDGLILTAAHVVQSPRRPVRIIFADGRQAEGVTLGMDRDTDAGMVRITRRRGRGQNDASSDPYPYAPVGDSAALEPGQWVLALGHPGGYQPGRKPVARIGRVLSVTDHTIVTDGPLVGGDSGGPLFTMTGEVVGIHSRIGRSLSANMHVATKSFQANWDRLVAGEIWGEVPRGAPYIGVRGDPDVEEARIAEVEPGQPADKAGIQVGDVVVKFDGQEVKTFSDLAKLVSECEPGEVVKVVVRRGEELVELELVIGRRR